MAMMLDRDETLIAVPVGAELAPECRAALEAYSTRPIQQRAGVGMIYVVAHYRVDELIELAKRGGIEIQRLEESRS